MGEGGGGGGSLLPCFPSLFPSLSSSPSHTFLFSQSPRAETLMKTNARNQFAASSFHLAGARLCTSISTPAGGELLQSSPITHTSVLRSRYGLQASLRERKRIKMGGMCYLKLSSENLFSSSEPRDETIALANSALQHQMCSNNLVDEQ